MRRSAINDIYNKVLVANYLDQKQGVLLLGIFALLVDIAEKMGLVEEDEHCDKPQ